jgi:hypothetical protein
MEATNGSRLRYVRTGISSLLPLLVFAAWPPGDPSGETILRNVQDAIAGVRDYSVMLDITAELDRLNVPPMKVRLYFKQPDKVHYEAQGFALLPREGLVLNIPALIARYSVDHVDRETVEGVPLYNVRLLARSDRTRLRTMLLYVHPVRWTIERLVTPQPGDRTMTASIRYVQVDGTWLPGTMVASFMLAPRDTADANLFEQVTPTRQPQLPRNGTVTVRYSEYRLNTGLRDSLFEKSPSRVPE